MFLLFGLPILIVNFACDCHLFFQHSYQGQIIKRLEKETPMELQAETYNMLKAAIRKRLSKRKMCEDALSFIKDVREQLQILPILRRMLIRHEFNSTELHILKEFNSFKAIINDCVLDHGNQKVILLPVLYSMLSEMKIQNRMQHI